MHWLAEGLGEQVYIRGDEISVGDCVKLIKLSLSNAESSAGFSKNCCDLSACF